MPPSSLVEQAPSQQTTSTSTDSAVLPLYEAAAADVLMKSLAAAAVTAGPCAVVMQDYALQTTTKTVSAVLSRPAASQVENRPAPVLLQEKMANVVDFADEDAFFVADLGEVVRQYQRWRSLLPRIEPYYAVKCNPDPSVLRTLVGLGIGFDCASRTELSAMLDLGVAPHQLIYANPCKQASHIRFAADQGVRMMTFDNAEELYKVKKHYPEAQLVLRILTDDSKSICKLGTKFGASPSIAKDLLTLAKSLELQVVGVSFHVGSGCFDALAFREAVKAARNVFDRAAEVGYDLQLLDVGGGFPGNCEAAITFEQIAAILGPAVDEMFPPSVRVIAEPGRFFVASAFTLAVNITARRTVVEKQEDGSQDTTFMYYVNDGVYGSFNCILFDHAEVKPKVLMKNGQYLYAQASSNDRVVKCSIWGPTCDSMDCITKQGLLPELDVGDWLYFDAMGAYTMCAASTFNGFKKSSILYTNTEL